MKQYKIGLVIEGDGKGGIKAISATETALKKYDQQQARTRKESDSLTTSLGKGITKATAIGATFTAITALAAGLASKLRVDTIRELDNMSQAFGVGIESLTSWGHAADSVGLSSEKMGDIFKDTADKIGDFVATGGGEAADLFENLNLSIEELKDLEPDGQLLAIAEGLESVGTQGEKVFYLESLADEASRLLPLLDDGAAGLLEMQQEAELLGVTLTEVDAAKVSEAAELFNTLGGATEGFANQITLQLAGAFTGLESQFFDWLETYGGMNGVTESVVNTTVDGIAFIINALHGLETILVGIQYGWQLIGAEAATMLTGLEDGLALIIDTALQPFIGLLAGVGEVVGALSYGFGSFLGETGEGLRDLGVTIGSTVRELTEFEVTGEDVGSVLDDMKGAAGETAQRLEDLRNSSPGDEFKSDFEAAQVAVTEQAEATVELAEANEAAREKLEEVNEATEVQTDASSVYAESWLNALERIDEAFADGWLDLIQGNATDVFDSILGGFEQMLAEMLHAAITQPIMLEFQASMGEGGGGIMDFLSGGSIGGVFESTGGFIAESFGVGNIFEGAGATSNLAMGAAGILGGLFGSTAGGHGDIGGSLGAMAGMAIGGPVGALIGGALGGAVGSLFGGEWEQVDNKLLLDYQGSTGFTGQHYTKEKKKKLWKNRYRENYSDLDADLANPISNYFQSAEEALLTGADLFGITEVSNTTYESLWDQWLHDNPWDAAQNGDLFGEGGELPEDWNQTSEVTRIYSLEEWLENFSASLELNLNELSEEEVEQVINDFAVNTTNDMYASVFGDFLLDMQNQGEALVDTLTRVITQLELVGSAFDAVNISLEALAGTSAQAQAMYADDVLRAAGGEDALAALLTSYQSNFFTEEEVLSRQLSNAIDNALGYSNAIGFQYGDDFRASFETAQEESLAAEELVQWLQTGELIAQFEGLAEQYAELTETSIEDVITRFVDEAVPAIIETASPEEIEDISSGANITAETTEEAEADPVVSEVSTLNETVNAQLGDSNTHLEAINEQLTDLNANLQTSLDSFKAEMKQTKTTVDSSIAQTQEQIRQVSEQSVAAERRNQALLQDVIRLNQDPKKDPYQTPDIIPRPIL